MEMKNMYYKNIAFDDVDEKHVLKKNPHLMMLLKKTRIKKQLT